MSEVLASGVVGVRLLCGSCSGCHGSCADCCSKSRSSSNHSSKHCFYSLMALYEFFMSLLHFRQTSINFCKLPIVVGSIETT